MIACYTGGGTANISTVTCNDVGFYHDDFYDVPANLSSSRTNSYHKEIYYDFINNDHRQICKKLYLQELKQLRLPISSKTNNKNNLSIKNYKPLPRNRLWRFRVKRPSKSFSY